MLFSMILYFLRRLVLNNITAIKLWCNNIFANFVILMLLHAFLNTIKCRMYIFLFYFSTLILLLQYFRGIFAAKIFYTLQRYQI